MKDIHEITLVGGKGGNGSISFRRERYIPRGGPDGGDGGRGGGISLVGTSSLSDLSHLMGVQVVAGENGGSGSGRKRSGKDGQSRIIKVPLGTVIWERKDIGRRYLGEVVDEGRTYVGVLGGQGGSGNTRFATSTNRTPQLALEGVSGERKEILLELRMKIDVGLIGMPNVGKSQLLQKVSMARPEVADYPFTTTEPAPAVVTRGWKTVVVAELPGILPGAKQSHGLRHSFLRHLWRARVLVHLIDGSAADPTRMFTEVNAEVGAFEASFLQKPQVLVVNKIDLTEVRAHIPALRRQLAPYGVARHFISALTGEGVEEMVEHLFALLDEIPPAPRPAPVAVVTPPVSQSRQPGPQVVRDGDVFVILSPQAERLVRLPDLRRFPARLQLRRQLARMGVTRSLEEAGVQPGDTVRIGQVEIKWE